MYYAGPGNKFWRTLHELGLMDAPVPPASFDELARRRFGLTDLAKLEFGMDRQLSRNAFDIDKLRKKIAENQPRILGFNGKKAGQAFFGGPVAYGLQQARIGETMIYVLPSTSGAANGFWDVTVWLSLAPILGARTI